MIVGAIAYEIRWAIVGAIVGAIALAIVWASMGPSKLREQSNRQ